METYRLDEIEIEGPPPTACEWFARCANAPSHIASHPVYEWVPICDRCLTRIGGR